jgi:P2 family phage contractile tail tube protein
MAEIPNIINDANIYVDGANWLGKAEVELPPVKHKTQGYQAFGVAGEIDIPVVGHVDKLEGTIKFKSMTKDAAKALYNPKMAPLLDARGSVQKYDPATGEMKQFPCKFTFRAFFTELKAPEFKQGADSGGEAKFAAHYMKLEIDGEEVLEIDQFNYIYKVNGVDVLAEVRQHLGT